ncbi:MAG: VOC family protein [Planctomycetes bacterium]|nr:VOC family protein [Planctomycetota bacterium]
MGAPVTHFQIVTKDPDALAAFYSKLCGWTVSVDNPLRYRFLKTNAGRGIEGGLWPAPPHANGFVQLHIEVADVKASVAEATALGAGVLVPPQSLPGGEVMAVLRDPDGIPFVLHSPAKLR